MLLAAVCWLLIGSSAAAANNDDQPASLQLANDSQTEAGGFHWQSGANRSAAAAATDEDVVISSSEILAASGPPDELARYRATDAPMRPQIVGRLDEGGGGRDVEEPAERQYGSSRFLLRFLVVGLFACVTCSLLLVYGIKFCVSRRRRKRRLHRRNLVADLSRQLEAAQCSCAQPEPRPPTRLHALLRPSLWPFWPAAERGPSGSLAASVYQQLALQQLAAGQAEPAPAAHCQACLSAAAAGGGWAAPRPPAYAELFGGPQPEPGPPAGHGGGRSPPSEPDGPSASGVQQQRGSLLVKLSLNKTKVLSADDLVLLSKLIDVPIVVHQDHQQQQQQQQQQQVVGGEQPLLSAERLMSTLNEEAGELEDDEDEDA